VGEAGNWCLIESDPGVFTELIKEFGVKGVQVEEMWSLDTEHFERLKPVHGLIFLFKWVGNGSVESNSGKIVTDDDIFFARQVIQNACATQAILSVLMNAENKVELGQNLKDFKSFIVDLDSESRGYAIGNSDAIRTVHNSFARVEPFFIEESKNAKGKKEDLYHFVAYLPYQGKVYELDGLKGGPILLGDVGANFDWLSIAKPAIEERMNRYASTETHFALLNICSSRSKALEKEMGELRASLDELVASNDETFNDTMNEIRTQIQLLQAQLDDINQEKERQRQENIRRRHNYFPFIMTLLKTLSTKGILPRLIEQAKTKAANNAANSSNKSK